MRQPQFYTLRWLSGGLILLLGALIIAIHDTQPFRQVLSQPVILIGIGIVLLAVGGWMLTSTATLNERLRNDYLQVQATQAVREVRRQAVETEAIINSLVDSVVVFDQEGVVRRANPQAIALFGFDPIRLTRAQIARKIRLYTEDGEPLAAENMPSVRAQEGQVMINERLRLDNARGRHYVVLVSSQPVTVGRDMIGVLTVYHDITERERLMEEIRRQREVLEQLVSSMNDIVFTLDRERRFTSVYGGAITRLQIDSQTMIGRTVDDVVSPSEQAYLHQDAVTEALAGRPAVYEWSTETAEGKIYFQTSLSPLREASGKITGVVGAVRDVSALKRAELVQHDYAERLRRSNEELEQFAFIASHDLQEPLRKVQAFSDRLVESLAGRLSESEKDMLDRMQNASARMRRMINDLLLLSRVTTQGRPFEEVNLNALALDVVSDLEESLRASQGQVILSDLPVIHADPMQMRQLLQNLIFNAIKFRRPGVAPRVTVRAITKEDRVRLEVDDNGIGFDPAHTERIFQPFSRLHGMSEYEGNGIGLAICKKITERHRGQITALSTPEVGSTFIVDLPNDAKLKAAGEP